MTANAIPIQFVPEERLTMLTTPLKSVLASMSIKSKRGEAMPREICSLCMVNQGSITVNFSEKYEEICIDCFEKMTGLAYEDEPEE
jgi:hypothetical protein